MSKQNKKKEEIYSLSFKGLLSISLNDDDVKKVMDNIELYLRRHHSTDGHPAIMLDLDDNDFHFVTLLRPE